jgi:ribosome assembly protein SQT1
MGLFGLGCRQRRNVITVEGGGFVDWHPTDNQIVGTGLSGTACVWDTNSGRQLLCVEHGDTVLSVRWNFDGSMIATGGLDGVVKVWDAQCGEPIATIDEHSNAISMLAWHPTRISCEA